MPSLFVPRGRARGTFAERGCSLRPNLAHQTVALVRASVEVHVPSCRLPCTHRVSHGLALRKSDWQKIPMRKGLRSNSLRIGTGNLIRPCRELIRAIREFFCLIRNPALAAISLRGKTECPTNSRMMSRVPEGDELHLSGADPQAHRPART